MRNIEYRMHVFIDILYASSSAMLESKSDAHLANEFRLRLASSMYSLVFHCGKKPGTEICWQGDAQDQRLNGQHKQKKLSLTARAPLHATGACSSTAKSKQLARSHEAP